MIKFIPSKLVSWDKNKEVVISRYIKKYLDLQVIRDNGEVTLGDLFQPLVYKKIIVHNIQINGIEEVGTRDRLVEKALFRIKKNKKQDIYGFRIALASEVKKYIEGKLNHYVVLFPLHVSPNNKLPIKQIKILGEKLEFVNWVTVKRRFAFNRFLNEADVHLRRGIERIILESRFVPLIVKVDARNAREGFDQVSSAFDLMRAIFTIYYHFHRYNIQFGGYPRPISKILPPPVYSVFTNKGEFDMYLFTTPKIDEYGFNNIDDQAIQFLKKMARTFLVPPSDDDTLKLIVEALHKYTEAHETNEWRLAFLLHWQILELITLQSYEQSNMKLVINRIAILLSPDNMVADLLSSLYETRNKLVHKGYFPDDEGLAEVSLIKSISERAIGHLFSMKTKLPTTQSLLKYYEHASMRDTELSGRGRVINFILQSRKSKSP